MRRVNRIRIMSENHPWILVDSCMQRLECRLCQRQVKKEMRFNLKTKMMMVMIWKRILIIRSSSSKRRIRITTKTIKKDRILTIK